MKEASESTGKQIPEPEPFITERHIEETHTRLVGSQSPEAVTQLAKEFIQIIKLTKNKMFHVCLRVMASFFGRGEVEVFATDAELLKKIMKQYTNLTYELDKEGSNIEGKLVFILSLIAEMIKQIPRFKYPFTKKFVQKVLLLNRELIEGSDYKDKILAILAVIYENLSAQDSFIKQEKLVGELKYALLEKYNLIEQTFSIKLFNKALYNLISMGEQLTQAELSKYNLVGTLEKFMKQSTMQIIVNRLKTLAREKKRKEKPKYKRQIGTDDHKLKMIPEEEEQPIK